MSCARDILDRWGINFYSFGARLLDRYLNENFSFNAVIKLVSNRVTTIKFLPINT